ncbi:MAG: nucleoid-associated protein, partial [Sphingobacteriales bacterium]
MISFSEASLGLLSVHRVGNKLLDEYFALSEKPLSVKEELLQRMLLQYFLAPFEKVNEVYRLFHPNNNLELNEVYHFVTEIFADPDVFHAQSMQIARHLFEVSNHPKIRSGELYIAFFYDVQIEGELMDAIGIFKSETKEAYMKVSAEGAVFDLKIEEEGINLSKLDKGCLIFKTEKEEGYKVAVADQYARSGEAVYWKDDFLKLKVRNDNYNQTNNILSVYKNFVTNKLDEDYAVSKADKIDLLNRSINYFKEKETFDLEEFGNEVIGNEDGFKAFKSYKESYAEDHDAEISDSFDINNAAVKKQARVYKSVLKLDRNFHIYIHGNKDLIEKGYDEDKHMNYY